MSSIKSQDPLAKESYSYLKISCVSSGDANIPPDPEIQHEALRRCSLVLIKKNHDFLTCYTEYLCLARFLKKDEVHFLEGYCTISSGIIKKSLS